jgi:hypothetical protein
LESWSAAAMIEPSSSVQMSIRRMSGSFCVLARRG